MVTDYLFVVFIDMFTRTDRYIEFPIPGCYGIYPITAHEQHLRSSRWAGLLLDFSLPGWQ